MQSDEERTLGNLCVLAAVSHNDKLCTLEDAFTIYAPTTMRGLVRMWYGERREANVQRVRQAVRSGIGFAQQSLEEVNALREAADTMRLRIDTTTLRHLRMVEALRRACTGMRNMLQTYKDDAALASQITLLVQEVEDFVQIIVTHGEHLVVSSRYHPHPPSSSTA